MRMVRKFRETVKFFYSGVLICCVFFIYDFFGVDLSENEMKRALNLEKCGAQTAYNFSVFFLKKYV